MCANIIIYWKDKNKIAFIEEMDGSNFQKLLRNAMSSSPTEQLVLSRRFAGLLFLLPIICMMLGGSLDDEGVSVSDSRGSSATVPVKLPGQLGGSCKHDLGGFCVPVGMCSPEDKIQGTQDICEAGLECCGKQLNNNLCASRGGECVAIGSCGEGVALFRDAEDCNRARHGKDCCIWM